MTVFISTFLHYPKLTHMAFPGGTYPAEGASIFPMANTSQSDQQLRLRLCCLNFVQLTPGWETMTPQWRIRVSYGRSETRRTTWVVQVGWSAAVQMQGHACGDCYQRNLLWCISGKWLKWRNHVSLHQGAAGKMQVWERANILLVEARGASRQGGKVLLHPIHKAGIPTCSKWNDAEKDYRVDQGNWESVLQEEAQSAQLVQPSKAKRGWEGVWLLSVKTSGGQASGREQSCLS